MGKIATERDVYNVGKKGAPVANKCCTKRRMEELGCKGINGIENYASNRLVPEGNYTKSALGSFEIDTQSHNIDAVLHCNNANGTESDKHANYSNIDVTANNWSVLIEIGLYKDNYYIWLNVRDETMPFSVKSINSSNCTVTFNGTGVSTQLGFQVKGLKGINGSGFTAYCDLGGLSGTISYTFYFYD